MTQERGPAAGGRRPLNPATEPFRAKGTAVAKPYVLLVLRCRPFKPFPSKLVYSRFPLRPRLLPPDAVFLQWRCFLCFYTWQAGRHRTVHFSTPGDALFDPQRRSFRPPETPDAAPWAPRCRTSGAPMPDLGPVDRKIHAMPLFPHYVIRVLGSVAGLGAHAPLRYK